MPYLQCTSPCARRIQTFALLLCLLLLPHQCGSFTEVFSIAKDSDDNTYVVGNRDSNFFIGKKSASCVLQWESAGGSTSSESGNDDSSEVLYDAIIGQDGLVYAVGSTEGNSSFPSQKVPNLDAAVLVYDPSSGDIILQKQYDVALDLKNIAHSITQKENGNLLIAVSGSASNLEGSVLYETYILEIDSQTLELSSVHKADVITTEELFPVTCGPEVMDFVYEDSTDSIIAVGNILGRGIIWKYSLASDVSTSQVEWGEALGNVQVSGFSSDGNGAYFVVGSSSDRVLENNDLHSEMSSEFHAYVIRYDNLDSSPSSPTWVRQLAGAGGSQLGRGITIDPVTGDVVIVGDFDANFIVTDTQTSETFTVNSLTDSSSMDVFLWCLDSSTGYFKELRSSSIASTASDDRGNAVTVLSTRTIQIGGIINDGKEDTAAVCDTTHTRPTSNVSSSPAASVTPLSALSITATSPMAILPSSFPVSSEPSTSSSSRLFIPAVGSANPAVITFSSNSTHVVSSVIPESTLLSNTLKFLITSFKSTIRGMIKETVSSSRTANILHSQTDDPSTENLSSLLNIVEARSLDTVSSPATYLEASQNLAVNTMETEPFPSFHQSSSSHEQEPSSTEIPHISLISTVGSFQSATPSSFDFQSSLVPSTIVNEDTSVEDLSSTFSYSTAPARMPPTLVPSTRVLVSSVGLNPLILSSSPLTATTEPTFGMDHSDITGNNEEENGLNTAQLDDGSHPASANPTSPFTRNEYSIPPATPDASRPRFADVSESFAHVQDPLMFHASIEPSPLLANPFATTEDEIQESSSEIFLLAAKHDGFGESPTKEFKVAISSPSPESLHMQTPTAFERIQFATPSEMAVLTSFDFVSEPSFSIMFTPEEVLHGSGEIYFSDSIVSSPDSRKPPSSMLESPEASRGPIESEIMPPLPSTSPSDAVPFLYSPEGADIDGIEPSISALISSESMVIAVSPLNPGQGRRADILSSESPPLSLLLQQTANLEISSPEVNLEESGEVANYVQPSLQFLQSPSIVQREENLVEIHSTDESGGGNQRVTPFVLQTLGHDEPGNYESQRTTEPQLFHLESSVLPVIFSNNFDTKERTPSPGFYPTGEPFIGDIQPSNGATAPEPSASDLQVFPKVSHSMQDEKEEPENSFGPLKETNTLDQTEQEGFPVAASGSDRFQTRAPLSPPFEMGPQLSSVTPQPSELATVMPTFSIPLPSFDSAGFTLAAAENADELFIFSVHSSEIEPKQLLPTPFTTISEGTAFSSEEQPSVLSASPFIGMVEQSMEYVSYISGEILPVPFAATPTLESIEGPFTPEFAHDTDDRVEATPEAMFFNSSPTVTTLFVVGTSTEGPTETKGQPEVTQFSTVLPSHTLAAEQKTDEGPESSTGPELSEPTPSTKDGSLFPKSVPPASISPEPAESPESPVLGTNKEQDVSRQPYISFMDSVLSSATPSSSPTSNRGIATGAPDSSEEIVSASPMVGEVTIPAGPAVTGVILLTTPTTTRDTSDEASDVVPPVHTSSSSLAPVSSFIEPSSTGFNPSRDVSPPSSSFPIISSAPTDTSDQLSSTTIPSTNVNAPTVSSSEVGNELRSFAPSESDGSPLDSTITIPVVSRGVSFSIRPTMSSSPSRESMISSGLLSPETSTPSPSISSRLSSPTTPALPPLISAVLPSPEIFTFQPSISAPQPSRGTGTSVSSVSSLPASSFLPSETKLYQAPLETTEITTSPEIRQELSMTVIPEISQTADYLRVSPLMTPFISEDVYVAASQLIPLPPSEIVPVVTKNPEISEELSIMRSPEMSQIAETSEASIAPLTNPLASVEVYVTASPLMTSPSEMVSLSLQPTPSSTLASTPSTLSSVSPSSSSSPTTKCVVEGNPVTDPDSLNQTRNFQRVKMVIQVAGPYLTNSCQFTGVISERFISLSATNTLSQADMWYITSIEDGPPIFEETSNLVPIEEDENRENGIGSFSPSPSDGAGRRTLFPGSARFNVTAFMDPLSVELASGPYVEYIDSQNIVKVMTEEGFDDIKWTGMVVAPVVADRRILPEETRTAAGGLSSGEISAIAIGGLLIVGVAGFVVIEGGVSTRRSGPILPV